MRRDVDKRPVRADNGRPASSTNPFTWASHERAELSPHGVGLGYVLDGGDRIVCIDLDHCIDGRGRLAAWAREIVGRCPATYIEVSPSGTGLHLWGRGKVWHGRRIRHADGACIEVYGRGRYIAMGQRYGDAPSTLADLSEVVDSLI